MVNDEQVQLLADGLRDYVLAVQLRPNGLTRYGEDRSGALATAAVLAGIVIGAGGFYRRMVRHTDPLGTERLYAQTAGVDLDRARADVDYIDQRLRLLALVIDDDPEELVRGAAHALVAFVTAGRPGDQRLDEVEHAYAPLGEATDDRQRWGELAELQADYLGAWRRDVS